MNLLNTIAVKKRKQFDISHPLSGAVYNRSSYKQNNRKVCENCGKDFGHYKQHIQTNVKCKPYWTNKELEWRQQKIGLNEYQNDDHFNHSMHEDNFLPTDNFELEHISYNVKCNDDKNSTINYINNIYKDTFGLDCMNSKTYGMFVEKSRNNKVSFPNHLTLNEIELFIFINRSKISIVEGNNLFQMFTSIIQSFSSDYKTQYRTYRTVRKLIKDWCEKRYTHYKLTYIEWPVHWKMNSCNPVIPNIEMFHVNLYESVQSLLANPEIMLNEEYCNRIMLQAKKAHEEIGSENLNYVSHLMTGWIASLMRL
jgi:hypothetical protein